MWDVAASARPPSFRDASPTPGLRWSGASERRPHVHVSTARFARSSRTSSATRSTPCRGGCLLAAHAGTNWRTGQRGVIITLADNGDGMAPQTLKRLFDPFFTTKGLTGTGLGLWGRKEMVDRHNGPPPPSAAANRRNIAEQSSPSSCTQCCRAPVSEVGNFLPFSQGSNLSRLFCWRLRWKGRVSDPAIKAPSQHPLILPKAGVQAKPKRPNCLLSNHRESWR